MPEQTINQKARKEMVEILESMLERVEQDCLSGEFGIAVLVRDGKLGIIRKIDSETIQISN